MPDTSLFCSGIVHNIIKNTFHSINNVQNQRLKLSDEYLKEITMFQAWKIKEG